MKTKKMSYLILAIFFILFNVVAFLLPLTKSVLFYTGYIFTVIAFIIVAIVLHVFSRKENLNSKFLNLPLLYLGISYIVIEVILFFIINALNLPLWLGIILYTILLGISLVMLLSTDKGVEANENLEKKILEKKNFLKNIEIELEFILKEEKDSEVEKALKDLIEKVKFSDPMSHDSLRELEEKISNKLDVLNNSNNKLDVIEELDLLLEKRNKKTLMLKK